MKLRLMWVGGGGVDAVDEASDVYAERIRRYFPLEFREIRPASSPKNRAPRDVKREEAQRIRRALGARDHAVALDPKGTELSSEQLAARMEQWQHRAFDHVVFVVGGPFGLDSDWAASAGLRWSLSRLTLQHRIARLVLLEQLFRAGTILRGEPYHK